MKNIKFLFVNLLLLACLSACSQDGGAVFLKWKLKPGEIITYKTVMKADSGNPPGISMAAIDKLMGDSAKNRFKKMLKQMGVDAGSDYITSLKENRKNIID